MIVVVLICALIVSLTDAGLQLPVPLVLGALLISLLFLVVVAVLGFLRGRDQGKGFWSSTWRGIRLLVRAVFDLF